MNVLVISRHYYRPGKITGSHLHRQCVELRKSGVNPRVICPVPRFSRRSAAGKNMRAILMSAKTAEIDGVNVTYLPYNNVPNWLSADLEVSSLRRSMLRYVRESLAGPSFDLLHAHRLFPTAAAALPIARELGIPFLASARGSDVHTNPWRNRQIAELTRTAIAESDGVLAVSRNLADELANLQEPRHPVRVIYNGVDGDVFKPHGNTMAQRRRFGLPVQGVGICTVTRLVVEKGLRELMGAFELLARSYPSAWLLIVGDGPARPELESWVDSSGLGGRVFVVGAKPYREITLWLNTADVFVLPSYKEGLPNVVLEAMACGLPVISTSVGGIPEAVDSDCAILIPPAEVDPLYAGLECLTASSALRKRMSDASLKRSQQHFSWARSAGDLADCYREFLAKARAA